MFELSSTYKRECIKSTRGLGEEFLTHAFFDPNMGLLYKQCG